MCKAIDCPRVTCVTRKSRMDLMEERAGISTGENTLSEGNEDTSRTAKLSAKGAGKTTEEINTKVAASRHDQRSATLPSAQPGSTLRNVVYYQNRFIVLDSVPAKSATLPSGSESATDGHRNSASRTGNDSARMPEKDATDKAGSKSNEGIKRVPSRADETSPAHGRNKSRMDFDATSVTMDARAIEIIVSDTDNPRYNSQNNEKKTVWKSITHVLIDNRMKGRQDCDRVLKDHPDEYKVLKNVLNILFVTIGVALLLSVFVVIIYTSVVGDPPDQEPAKAEINGDPPPTGTTDSKNLSDIQMARRRRNVLDLEINI